MAEIDIDYVYSVSLLVSCINLDVIHFRLLSLVVHILLNNEVLLCGP